MRVFTLSASYRLVLLALTGLWCAAAAAQNADPPARVARLSDAEGAVSLQPAGVTEWTQAQLNRPLTSGDRLWSEPGSRAELDLGNAVVRLGSSTGFSFLNLDDHGAQMQLPAGTLIVLVRDMQAGDQYEIDTPNLAVTLHEPGEYRVEVNEAGDRTVVKVSAGSAAADGGGQSVVIGMQQQGLFTGTQVLSYERGALAAPDDLDAWSAARDRGLQNSPSRDYVADDVPGTQDLDSNGIWEAHPDYGVVWVPTIVGVVVWAPYRFGHWAWVAPWGWTWIDDAPWGFAPFHYGRWVLWNSTWCWVPGARGVPAVYSPALVGWVGGPEHGAPGALGPRIGWFPLAPREVYVPPYAVSTQYLRGVNIGSAPTFVNHANPYNLSNVHYANNTPGAVTAVPQEVFTSGQRVGGHALRVSPTVLGSAAVSATAPAIAPLRQSVLGVAPAHAVAHPSAAYWNRPLLVHTPPPRAPAPFDQQLAAIQANGGHPLPRSELARLQPAAAAAPVRVLPGSRAAGSSAPAGGLPNFAEREHALEHSLLPSVPRQNSYVPSAPALQETPPGSVAAKPAPLPRSDRAQGVVAAPVSPPGVAPEAPHYRPPAVVAAPVSPPGVAPEAPHYRPPAVVAAPVSPPGVAPEAPYYRPPVSPARVVEPTPVVRAPPAPPPAPPHAPAPPAAREVRDSSTHTEADSRAPH
jgi:hypothetical protein